MNSFSTRPISVHYVAGELLLRAELTSRPEGHRSFIRRAVQGGVKRTTQETKSRSRNGNKQNARLVMCNAKVAAELEELVMAVAVPGQAPQMSVIDSVFSPKN